MQLSAAIAKLLISILVLLLKLSSLAVVEGNPSQTEERLEQEGNQLQFNTQQSSLIHGEVHPTSRNVKSTTLPMDETISDHLASENAQVENEEIGEQTTFYSHAETRDDSFDTFNSQELVAEGDGELGDELPTSMHTNVFDTNKNLGEASKFDGPIKDSSIRDIRNEEHSMFISRTDSRDASVDTFEKEEFFAEADFSDGGEYLTMNFVDINVDFEMPRTGKTWKEHPTSAESMEEEETVDPVNHSNVNVVMKSLRIPRLRSSDYVSTSEAFIDQSRSDPIENPGQSQQAKRRKRPLATGQGHQVGSSKQSGRAMRTWSQIKMRVYFGGTQHGTAPSRGLCPAGYQAVTATFYNWKQYCSLHQIEQSCDTCGQQRFMSNSFGMAGRRKMHWGKFKMLTKMKQRRLMADEGDAGLNMGMGNGRMSEGMGNSRMSKGMGNRMMSKGMGNRSMSRGMGNERMFKGMGDRMGQGMEKGEDLEDYNYNEMCDIFVPTSQFLGNRGYSYEFICVRRQPETPLPLSPVAPFPSAPETPTLPTVPSPFPSMASQPTLRPTFLLPPTFQPQSREPTGTSTGRPSFSPTFTPTTTRPTREPTDQPSISPVSSPPTRQPTQRPSSSPVSSPPTRRPTERPTQRPSMSPVSSVPQPSNSPVSSIPTRQPTRTPTVQPTTTPVSAPPTKQPVSVLAMRTRAPIAAVREGASGFLFQRHLFPGQKNHFLHQRPP